MTCTGITGTNGKTTTSYLVDAILGGRYGKTAVMGTLGGVWGGECRQFGLTTPESPVIAREMASMKHDGCRALTMEASSHGLALGRLAGIEFDLAIFTNLSRDHLDFHRDMEHYLEAKLSLFKELGRQSKEGVGIVNLDDPRAKSFLDVSDAKVLTYAIGRDEADVSATDLRLHPDGTDVTVRSHIGDTRLHLRLLGRFNVSNALAGFAAGLALNMGEREIVTGLESVEGVRGRMQMIEVRGIRVVIDYAHTPEALEKLLETLREVFSGRLVTVVGCGGDRDREKRPMMGEVAARLSRDLVITSDNPRSEDPEAILDDLEEGIRLVRDDFKRLTSREEAIQFALDMAESGDIVVIAGKGHEDYQIVAGKRYHFDDLEVARRFLGCGGGQKHTQGGVV
jgi:UDP-N-acetylmuramoyl-L-alanyl-D-glutamate--2,6-diaminopimelate ligase